MRILLINNFFRDVGGIERVFFDEREMLVTHGHTVIDFSTHHVDNHPSPYAEFFVSSVDFQRRGNFFKKAARFFYSREVDKKLSALIKKTQPHVVHIHGIFDVLGPSVLWVLRRHNIKIIFTAHAYKLICPNWKLFVRGKIDEGCKKNPFHDAWNCSIQNSFIKSFGAAAAWWWHEKIGTFTLIHRIISPSQFLIDKHVEFGWPRETFVHIPNPFDAMRVVPAHGDEKFILFVGRLVPEKGVDMMIQAAAHIPEIPFIVIGDGPDRDALMQLAREKNVSNISFVGKKSPRDVLEYTKNALAVVVPSVWYENDSISVIQTQALAKIVIASYIGGIPEQIRHGVTGFLYEAGNPDALAKTILHVCALSPEERHRLGVRARGMVDTVRAPELYYDALMAVLG